MKTNLKKFAAIAVTAVTLMASMNACKDEAALIPATPSNTTSLRPIKHIGDSTTTDQCKITNISANRTFFPNNTYILHGDVRVNNGATLTIAAGCIVKGASASKGTLTIERGAKIQAQGVLNNPIVFTSDKPAGSRAPKDWGGIIILGEGISNKGINQIPEGYPTCTPQVAKPTYGGNNNADNSGRMSFCRIEFAGVPVTTGDEKNSLSLYGVGSGTKLDHIMCSYGGDDSFEWFGGAVNANYLLSYRGGDDDFDTDNGYVGKVQYGIALRDPALADNSTSNGFESDNDAGGSALLPQTAAVFSNFLLIGPYDPACVNTPVNTAGVAVFGDGLHLRRNTGIKVYNSIITGWPLRQTFVAPGVTAVALSYNTAVKPFNVVASVCVTEPVGGPWSTGISNLCNDALKCTASLTSGLGMIQKSGLEAAAWNLAAPSFKPVSQTNAIMTNGTNAALIEPSFFLRNSTTSSSTDTTFFRGARRFVNDNGWKFTSGWVNYDPQNTPYL